MVPLASGRKQIDLYASWVFESNEEANGYHHLVRVNAYVFAAYLHRLAEAVLQTRHKTLSLFSRLAIRFVLQTRLTVNWSTTNCA